MKNVLITGGSRGIGSAMVRIFAKNGYKVYFTYKNSDTKAKALEEETGAVAIKADVMDCDTVRSKISGNLYALINNAGIAQQKLFQDISDDDWDKMFDVNIKGMFKNTREFIGDFISEKNGRIINISSIWGISGASCEVHYSASKAAVIGFSKALAKELGPSGVTVNCIAPGVIDTDMNKNITEETMKELADETPVGRLGKPEDVAALALFLCSDEAQFITGQVISADGGFLV